MLETARVLAQLDIQAIKIHLLYVVRNTPLHKMYDEGRYTCLSREMYAEIVSKVLAQFPPSVVIHRLTGDPHPAELIAPLWALEKQRNLDAIHEALRTHQLRQGMNFSAG
jgi:radical SAM superfamily enzyme